MFYYFYDLVLKNKSNCKYNIISIKSGLNFIKYNFIFNPQIKMKFIFKIIKYNKKDE